MSIIRHTSIANQVNEILKERIRDGEYSPGMRLPSESELAKEFEVSRATVRTVLARMNAEGIILRKQGDGTYINEHIQDVNTHLGGLWEFSRLIESSGFQPSIKTIRTETRIADAYEEEYLRLNAGEIVFWMQRLFYADDQPVILANNAIPKRFIKSDAEALISDLPIQKFLDRYCHKKVIYVILDMGATTVSAQSAALLELEAKQPQLNINTYFYDRDNQPLVCGQSFINDTILRLRLVQTWG